MSKSTVEKMKESLLASGDVKDINRFMSAHNIKNKIVDPYETMPKNLYQTSTKKTKIDSGIKNQYSKIKDKIKSHVDSVKSITDYPPRFLKPVYFLDDLTPFVHAKIKVAGGGVGLEETIIDIIPSNIQKEELNYKNENNIISKNGVVKSLNFDAKTRKIELVLSDVEQDIIDFLGTVFVFLEEGGTKPIIELEYGWGGTKEDSVELNTVTNLTNEDVSDSLVYFRKTVLAVVVNLKVKYTPEGIAELSLECSKEDGFPEPFHFFLPYDFLGAIPGVTLQMLHSLRVVALIMNSFESADKIFGTKNNRTEKAARNIQELCEFFYYYKQTKTTDMLIDVIEAAVLFFREDLAKIWSGKDNLSLKALAERTIKKYIKSKDRVTKDLISLVQGEAWGKKAEQATKSDSNKENIKRFLTTVYVNNKVDIFDQHENLRKELQNEDGGNKYGYHAKLRNLTEKLTPLLGKALIHPWALLQFCTSAFEKHFDLLKSKANITDDLTNRLMSTNFAIVRGFNKAQIAGYYIGTDASNKTKSRTQPQQTTEYPVYNKDLEKFYIKSQDITIASNETWESLFNQICSKIHVWIDEEIWTMLHTEDSDPSTTKSDLTYKNQKNVKNKVPMAVSATCKVLGPKEAKQSLETYKHLLKARKGVDKITDPEKESDETTIINVVDTLIDAARNNNHLIILYLDPNPGIGGIFDQSTGKNHILQAYSYRAGGSLLQGSEIPYEQRKQFNPGVPSVWDISFPDVVSFEPELQFREQTTNLYIQMKRGMKGISGKTQIDEDIDRTKQEIKNKAKEKEEKEKKLANSKKNKKAGKLTTKLNSEIKKLNSEIKNLKSTQDNLAKQKEKYVQIMGKLPYRTPADLLFKKSTDYTHHDIVEMKKQVQEYRRRIIADTNTIKATFSVLGDPIFDIFSIGKYIFIRFLNPDGTLGIFTGIYIINGVKQEISAGKFITSFEVNKDHTADSDVAQQIVHAMTNSSDVVFSK